MRLNLLPMLTPRAVRTAVSKHSLIPRLERLVTLKHAVIDTPLQLSVRQCRHTLAAVWLQEARAAFDDALMHGALIVIGHAPLLEAGVVERQLQP